MINYFNCPYCYRHIGGHAKTVPKTVGKYRVKIIKNRNFLIFQCQKCLKTFRVRMMGVPLLWTDMTHAERLAFKQRKWIKEARKNE